MNIKITFDKTEFTSKEEAKRNAGAISKRIGSQEIIENISTIAKKIGDNGCTWNPCTYLNGRRTKEEFKDCQLFALDFDKGIPYEIIKNKFNKYHIPISFSYYTLSSTPDKPKYRIVLCHESIITDSRIAMFILLMLKNLFSKEADLSCFELSRLYFGGKEIIEINDTPCHIFNIYDLSCIYQQIMRETNMKHFSENQQKISNYCQIELMGKSLFNLQCFDNSTSGDFERNPNIIYIELPLKSQIVSIHLKDCTHPTPHPQNKREIAIPKLEKITNQKLCSVCKLWDDFYNRRTYLEHNERFALALNIIHIKGFEKIFFEIHNTNYPDSNKIKWITDIEYAKTQGYKPQNCDFCRYSDSCSHESNILETLKGEKTIFPVNQSTHYVSADDAYQQMKKTLKKILKSNKPYLYLIKAQTGLGKTRLYIDLIKKGIHKKPFLIAVPSTTLKTEIYNKLENEYIMNFPSLDDLPIPSKLHTQIKELYFRGLNKAANDLLREFYEKHPALSEINLYLYPFKYLAAHNNNVIMTHARFLELSESILKNYEIIIDEDILYFMLHRTGEVSINTLKKGVQSKIFTSLQEKKIHTLLKLKEGHYSYYDDLSDSYEDIEILDKLNISDNISAFFKANSFYRTKDSIIYLLPIHLEHVKLTILSSTINDDIYERFFLERMIKFYQIDEVKYKGNLLQYYYYSSSRSNLQKMGQHFPSRFTFFERIKSFTPKYDYTITFKEYERYFSNDVLHFGNTAGIDYYSGQDGLIIGTYHLPEYVYKLACCSINGMKKNKLHKQILRRRRIEFNGYSFPFLTYDDNLLQLIQLYLISTELEQAIGRSRLLRTNSTIYLFSNFPCPQAKLSKIDYLKKGNADALS